MPPQESDALLKQQHPRNRMSMEDDVIDASSATSPPSKSIPKSCKHWKVCIQTTFLVVGILAISTILWKFGHRNEEGESSSSTFNSISTRLRPPYKVKNTTGMPYKLQEVHSGSSFLDYYDFYEGADSLGSAGYNTYVGQQRAQDLNLISIEKDDDDVRNDDEEEYIIVQSKAGSKPDSNGNRLRESIRLQGKTRFDHGLIVLDVLHMPTGCGVWPAFWTTDESHWPDHGEIDIVEGINTQSVAKTALHTSTSCDMYAHVPRWSWSGQWDVSTGLPDTFTGQPNFDNQVQADNCDVMAPHQWQNQGCVAVSTNNQTLGRPINDRGGGIYVLEWDPSAKYIRSWVFARDEIPKNLLQSINSADTTQKQKPLDGKNHNSEKQEDMSLIVPDPSSWPVPYAYFAIGEGTGCSADHFQNHHIVLNLAFCGSVAGNRFQQDCPSLFEKYNVHNNSVWTCNAYLDSNPQAVEEEAYWKIRGVYFYQRG